MDYPVEQFSQALARREDNRKALLKWIQSNLQAGIDFGQGSFNRLDDFEDTYGEHLDDCEPEEPIQPSRWSQKQPV